MARLTVDRKALRKGTLQSHPFEADPLKNACTTEGCRGRDQGKATRPATIGPAFRIRLGIAIPCKSSVNQLNSTDAFVYHA